MKVNIISTGLLLAVCIYAVAADPYSNGNYEDTDLDEPLWNSRVLAALLASKRDTQSVVNSLRAAAYKIVNDSPAADVKSLLTAYFSDNDEIKNMKDTDLKQIILKMIQKKL